MKFVIQCVKKHGVCIYIRSSINYKIRSDLIPPTLEAVCLEITKPQSKPFIVSTIYRPPNAPPCIIF